MRKFIFAGNLYSRLLLFFTLLVCLLVLVSFYALYDRYQKSTLETVSDMNTQILSQMSFSADSMNANAINFAWTIMANSKTQSLMYQEFTDYASLRTDLDNIRSTVESNAFLHSLYIYNRREGRMLSSGPVYMSGENDFYDQGAMELIRERVKSFAPFPRVIRSPIETLDGNTVYSYVFYDMTSKTKGIEGAVIVNVNGAYLDEVMNTLRKSDSQMQGETLIVDSDGDIVNSTKTHFLQNISDKPYIERIKASESAEGYFVTEVDGRKTMITYVSLPSVSWTFIHIQPFSNVLEHTRQIRNFTLVICLFVLTIGVTLSFLGSRVLYEPLRKVLSKVQKLVVAGEPKKGRLDEPGLIDWVLREIHSNKQDKMRLIRNKAVLSLLMTKEIAQDQIEQVCKDKVLDLRPDQPLILIVFRIDGYGHFSSTYSESDQELLRYAVSNVAREVFGRSMSCETTEFSHDMIVVIANSSVAGNGVEWNEVMGCVTAIQHWCLDHLKLSLSAALQAVPSATKLPYSFYELRQLILYRLVYGHGAIITPERVAERAETDGYRIGGVDESRLHNALINGKYEETLTVFADIMDKVRSGSHDAVISNVLHLMAYLFHTMNTMEKNSHDYYNIDLRQLLSEIEEAETLDEINDKFRVLFEKVIVNINSRKDKRHSILARTIADIIEKEYADKNLSLDFLADKVNYSKVYMSKVFRDTYDTSIPDYILDFRIKKTLEGLKDGNKHLSELLDEIGVENTKYFYALFKKKVGVSIKDYKLKNTTNQLEE